MSIETNCLIDYKLNDDGIKKLKEAKKIFSDFQQSVLGALHPSRETSIVKSKLEEASFYMSKAIAQREENHSQIITH